MSEKLKENQDKIFQEIREKLTTLSPAYRIKLLRVVLTPELEHEIEVQGDPQIQSHLALLYNLWEKNKHNDPAEGEEIIQESISAIRNQ